MAAFELTLTNPSTGRTDITEANDIFTIVDHSNYDEGSYEAGHAQADFSLFYKILITNPDGTTYLFSSIGDGDESLDTPDGETLPISITYPFTTGDGQYYVDYYVVPTYNAGANYLAANSPHVYYGGKFWKKLTNGAGVTPVAGADWAEVTLAQLPTKYHVQKHFVSYSGAKEVFARRVYNSLVINQKVDATWDNLYKDPEWIDAVKIMLDIEAIPAAGRADDFDRVDAILNHVREISAKY